MHIGTSSTFIVHQTSVVGVPFSSFHQVSSFLRQLNSCIHARLDDPTLGISELQFATATSRTQLYRKLKSLSGMSPSIYIRHIRLQEAKRLLLTTEDSVSSIAYQVGFNDRAYFSRVFQKTYQMSPTQLRHKRSPRKNIA